MRRSAFSQSYLYPALSYGPYHKGTGDSRESFAIETPIFIDRQADSHESLECPIRCDSRELCESIRANQATKALAISVVPYEVEGRFRGGGGDYNIPTCAMCQRQRSVLRNIYSRRRKR